MKRIITGLAVMQTILLVPLFLLPIESIPRSAQWEHFAVVALHLGIALCFAFLARHQRRLFRILAYAVSLCVFAFGTLWLMDLVYLLSRSPSR